MSLLLLENAMTPAESKARLAVDIGGTFTDVVLQTDSGERFTTKLLTTYDHPGRAVLDGITGVLQQSGLAATQISLIIHGTTLATNALIERQGARTALLTTQGHRDALEMAHEDRFEQYDINIDRPVPLVPRHLRLAVTERMDRHGNVLIPLDPVTVEECLPILDQHEIESVAIGYLHAFMNPAHEQQTADILSKARPDLSLTLASEVAPEIREFERLSTACANAYVRPLMSRYLNRLAGELLARELRCPFFLMTSGGGLTTLDTAARFPIRLVESGPAGGAILASEIARDKHIPNLLSFDMGGTTAKLCLIDEGQPLMSRSFEVDRVYRFKKGSGLPVRIPVIEMVEIGAGGGSIAKIDKLKRIQVGPASAGSEPGPAAYGRGGLMPTVTDADVCLGKIPAQYFAFPLDSEAAAKSIGDLGYADAKTDLDINAFGISEIVDENMAAAARAHAAEFGLDLQRRDIVAFGGAAPLHAARLGQKIGAKKIIIPRDAGVGSAVGFLMAPVAFEVVRSHQLLISHQLVLSHQPNEKPDLTPINQLFDEMHREAFDVVHAAAPAAAFIEQRQAYMRYVGQGHELAIELPGGPYNNNAADAFRDRFEAAYKKLYGHIIEDIDVEVLSWTLTLKEPINERPEDSLEQSEDAALTTANDADSQATPFMTQSLFDAASARRVDAPVYLRADLAPGTHIAGPALITEPQTTTVVTSCYFVTVDPAGNLILERQAL